MANEEVWQVLDQSIEIELSGKKYMANLLPIKSIFAWAEGRAVSKSIQNIHALAVGLEGDEKRKFLAEAVSAIPAGVHLMEQAKTILYSLEAVGELLWQALHKSNPTLTREEINSLVIENAEGVGELVKLLIHGGVSKKATA